MKGPLTTSGRVGLLAIGAALIAAVLLWMAAQGRLLASEGLLPHGVCYTWNPTLIGLHLVSDSLIALAYFSIPLTLAWFVRKRTDLPFNWMFVLFGVFIMACGATHLMEVWTLWNPQYWLAGGVKVLTATASVVTAIALVPLVPRALALPSVRQLEDAKRALEAEVAERKRIEEDLRRWQAELEARVASRTRDLAVANEKLAREHEWLRVTLASIGDAVIAADTEARITLLNPVAAKLTGWSDTEAAGKPLADVFTIINESTRAPAENPAFKAMREGAIVGLANHTLLIARDGTEVHIDDSAAPIVGSDGQTLGVVLVFRDIGEKRAIEKALRDADRRKDHFLAVLSHELRGPLHPIRNAVGILRAVDTLDGEALIARDMIERQVGHLARLLDDLLDVSRIMQNKLSLRRAPIELRPAVLAAVEACHPHFEARGHQIDVSFSGAPCWITADGTRIEQVLCNLLTNAARYTDRGGNVAVAVTCTDHHALINVKDSGVGVAPENLATIFELFSQIDTTLSGAREGLGIGLSVAKSLVEMHGGTLTARSDGLGKGAEFIVELPLAPAPVTVTSAGIGRSDERKAARPLRVLITDDSADSLRSLAMLLELLGHEVMQSGDGKSALAAAQTFLPEVVVLDIGMPGMNGYEVAARMRQEVWCAKTVLIAVTGWGQDSDKRKAQEAGFDRHFTKPVDIAILSALLAEVAAR